MQSGNEKTDKRRLTKRGTAPFRLPKSRQQEYTNMRVRMYRFETSARALKL